MLKYKSYAIRDLETIPQLKSLNPRELEEIRVVSEIYPFKTNNYVVGELIDWQRATADPIFRLNFPQREMLLGEHFDQIVWGKKKLNDKEYKDMIQKIRRSLNPHPAGQLHLNIPKDESGQYLEGIQHKYQTTLLFFPSQSQTCHAYCTFCFRWPQFIHDLELKIQSKEITPLLEYLRRNEDITDVLITGGDPMVMTAKVLATYVRPLLELPNVKAIRIGTKSLSYWPHKFVTDADVDDTLALFREVIDKGKHLAFMAHFNHPEELKTAIVQEAIYNIRQTGAEIRTQAPLLRHINDNPKALSFLWQRQVELGCIPYYLFLPRDTGAQHYFAHSLGDALDIYRHAVRRISGLCRTVRGPIMSATSGKMELLDIEGDTYYLRYLQHRVPEMAYKIFKSKSKAKQPKWFDDLSSCGAEYEKFFDTGLLGSTKGYFSDAFNNAYDLGV